MSFNICITGATGFIGDNLIKELQNNSKHKIFVIIRTIKQVEFFNNIGIDTYLDDGDTCHLIDYFKNSKIDVVIHLASLYLKEHHHNEIGELINSNILFGTRLLEASAASSVKTFINTGTFWQFYHSDSYCPVNLYSATKQAFESIAKYYTETSDLTFITIYLNDTFGPGDTRKKIINIWNSLIEDEELKMSPGEQKINILYISDVINGFIKILQCIEDDFFIPQKTYNYVLKNNEEVTLKELANLFENVTGKKLNINWGAYQYKNREIMETWKGGELVPGWKPIFSLAKGIEKIIEKLNLHD